MRDEELWPDVITYTSIIGGIGLVGQPDKARNILKEMKEHGCYPDVAEYNAAIKNYTIAKRLGDAFSLMDEMDGKEDDVFRVPAEFTILYVSIQVVQEAWKGGNGTAVVE
ncbi:hypothetical protein F3Y22_tig00110607pilonHSYRG00167 [Hibiscus syriacus]|uniref:Pentatricopeptide repeat-containing protein n=1 Tax=Hibiscus syriacus TaxID=106335 RepID=A0A6A3A3Y6_HIBSY|nr:hypothetical protein F3Y22_tig00110607pilonHSYRG00167 [Hibiscus syriacus]